MKIFIISTLIFIFIYFSCDNTISTVSVDDSYQITLSTKIIDVFSGVPLSESRVDLISGDDTLTIYADSVGCISLQINPDTNYEMSFFSMKYADTSFSFNSHFDSTLNIKMSPVNYYPTEVGSYWKYIFQYDVFPRPEEIYLIIEREIIESDSNLIKSKLLLNGYTIRRSNTIIDTLNVFVNEVINTIEPLYSNGWINTFLHFIPEIYIPTDCHIKYSTINEFSLKTLIY